MKFKKLKAEGVAVNDLLKDYVEPNQLFVTLEAEQGSPLPKKLEEAFNDYKIEHNRLKYAYKKMQDKIDEETRKGTGDDTDLNLEKEIKDLYSLTSSFQRLHVNLQLARNLAYREKHQQAAFSSDQKSEKIVLTNQDFSQTCVGAIKGKINDILNATGGLSNTEQMSAKLADIGHEKLVEGGVSNGHLKDYPRRAYVFLNNDLPKLNNPTSDPIKDDLETVVQAYLTHHKLNQNAAPNVRAMITTLSYQSGLQGMGDAFLRSGFMHTGLAADFDFKALATRSTVFFNQETGKLQFEMFMEREILELQSQTLVKPANVSQKITVDIDVKKDAEGHPTFIAGDPKISFSIVRPISFAETHPIRIARANLQDTTHVDERYIDSFRPFLENFAKFAGYPSLEEVYYSTPKGEQAEKSQRFGAKRSVETANFDSIFINMHLKTLNLDEKAFLQKLSNDHYIKGKNKAELAEEIFQFVEEQLNSGKLSHPDKFRYMNLLKVGAGLSGDENRAAKIIDNLVNNQFGMNKNEKAIFLQQCIMVYKGETGLKKLSSVIANSVQSEINKIEDSKEIDEARLTYLVTMAVDYSLPLPSSFDPEKLVTILSNMPDSKAALLQGAKLHEGVYQQILEPPKAFWFFEALRTFGEWLGIVNPRPNEKMFSEQEHAELIGKHFPLSETGVSTKNPYLFLTENPDQTFTGNVEFQTLEGKLAFLKEFAANRSSSDFDDLIQFAPNFLKDCDAEFSDPKNIGIFWKQPFLQYFSDFWKNGQPEVIMAIMKEMPGFFAAAATRQDDFLPAKEKLAFLVEFPNSPSLTGKAGDAFFKGLDQKLTGMANQPVNPKNNQDKFIRSCFARLLSNPDSTIRFKLPNLFASLETNVPASSPRSINNRLEMLLKAKDLNMSKDELVVFLNQLNKDLLTLAEKQFSDPSYTRDDNIAIDSIIKIVQSDPKIQYREYGREESYSDLLTGFEAILNISVKPNPQAEHLIHQLAEARLRITKDLQDASQKIDLATPAPQSSTAAPVPVESSDYRPH